MKLKRILLDVIPALIFLIPAIGGIAIEIYNRQFREWATPFLWVAIGLILIGVLFLIRKSWALAILGLVNIVYLTLFLVMQLWTVHSDHTVYYYRDWWLQTKNGHMHLEGPLGTFPPEKGPYISCHFSRKDWLSYVNFQPSLCTAFDEHLRLLMFFNDHETEEGLLREFQMNQFRIARKTLLGDPVDRMAIRIAFTSSGKGRSPEFTIREMYQVYEKELEGGQSRILESISRDSKGRLRTLTESSLPNLTDRDLFAVYNYEGFLTRIPKLSSKTFSFPGKIDVNPIMNYALPERITPGGLHAQD